jgi:predicted nuclease of predicted toxin-antitoxin system
VRLLLDCHIAKATVTVLQKRHAVLDTEHLATWHSGHFLRSSDEEILVACHRENRVLVTFDQRTIPDLLRAWASGQRPHAGVIFGDTNTVKPNRPASVAAALARLVTESRASDMTNIIRYLRSTR